MEKKVRYRLGKIDRLKGRKAIEQLFKEGKYFSFFPFRVIYILQEAAPPAASQPLRSESPGLRTGFSVSSRNFKKAVDRNRIKRLMREAWRLQKNDLQQLPELHYHSLKIFLIYTGKEMPEYEVTFEKTGLILKRLIKITIENR